MKIPLKKHWAGALSALNLQQRGLEEKLQSVKQDFSGVVQDAITQAEGPKEVASVIAMLDGDEPYLIVTPKPEPANQAPDPQK